MIGEDDSETDAMVDVEEDVDVGQLSWSHPSLEARAMSSVWSNKQ